MGVTTPPRSLDENKAIPFFADAVVDIAAAVSSACCVAPFVATVDKAVVEASAGRATLGRAMLSGTGDLLRLRFIAQPSYWMVAGVYAATYSAANLIDSACERMLDRGDPSSSKVHGAAKLIGTTCANMSAAISKDVMFAKMFGAASAPGPMPKSTIGFFALRDILTIGAAFTLPAQLAALFTATGAVEEKYAGETAQIVSPIAMQVACSPVHLMALHCYNVRHATVVERLMGVWRTLPQTTLARMCRMAPAFGIGGVMNTSLVHRGRDRNLREYYEHPRAATEPDDAGPWPEPPPVRRRRVAATYTKLDAAMELLGDVDSAALEAADAGAFGGGGGALLRRLTSRTSSSSFVPAQAGYYPELSDLVERRLGLDEEASPLSGLLGDARDVPDIQDADLAARLQLLNSTPAEPVRAPRAAEKR